jgi:hypothetical protein
LKKYLIVLLPLIFGISNAWAELSIENDQQYLVDDGSLHIVGEIRNDLNVPLNQIYIHATLYSNGQIIHETSGRSLVNTIMPGMKGPFDIIILGEKTKLVDNYSLELDYKITDPKNQVIEITTSKINRDNLDNLFITGIVANQGEITANTVTVVATLYDRDGKVVAVSKTHTKPDYLRASDETFFLVSIPDKFQANNVVDYTLVAESEEYAPVPEFPLGTLLLLASSVSVYILFTRYSSRVITNLVSASNPK